MPYDPRAYWLERGGISYMASIGVPDYKVFQEDQEKFIRDKVLPLNPNRLLDFGCGTGKLFHLWESIPYPEGYDISATMLEEANKTAKLIFGPHLRAWQFPLMTCGRDRTKLPYASNRFDVIVACEVLAHIIPDEIDPTLVELVRILKPDGVLALVVPSPFEPEAEYNFDYDYKLLLSRDFEITYDCMCEPYRHMLATVRKDAD